MESEALKNVRKMSHLNVSNGILIIFLQNGVCVIHVLAVHMFLFSIQVTHVGLILIAKDYNPEKYEDLSKILTKLYCRTGKLFFDSESARTNIITSYLVKIIFKHLNLIVKRWK